MIVWYNQGMDEKRITEIVQDACKQRGIILRDLSFSVRQSFQDISFSIELTNGRCVEVGERKHYFIEADFTRDVTVFLDRQLKRNYNRA